MRAAALLLAAAVALAGCEVPTEPANPADRQAAYAYMVTGLVTEAEIPRDAAETFATCALNAMTPAEISRLARVRTEAERHAMFNSVQDQEGLSNCVFEAAIVGAL